MPFYDKEDIVHQQSLVERARLGDSEAFSELVCLHRARMVGMARRFMHDLSGAEDIVQEALVQAFLNINKLSDPERFTPWLNRIVRNQALMKRRKDGRLSQESTFTDMTGGMEQDSPIGWNGVGIDDLLYQLTLTQNRDDRAAPETVLMRKEFYEALQSMLHSLSSREKELFEAHFFSQLDPKEMANLFRMTEGSVYKSLSRIKTKMKGERLRHNLRSRLRDSEGERERNPKVLLPCRIKDDSFRVGECSIASCIHRILPYTGDGKSSLSDVMGWTGLAFRLNLESERIDTSGPSMYFWEPVFEAGMKRLGCTVEHVGDGGVAPSAFMLGESIALARRSIANGIPAIAWDLNGPEFGLLYGYDDDRFSFCAAVQGRGRITVPYDKLGRGQEGGLFVMAVNRHPMGRVIPEGEAPGLIADILAHAGGEQTFPGYVSGQNAYIAWQDALRGGDIDPLGNAYCLRLALQAREYAVRFLRDLSRCWEGELSRLAFEAEGHYYDALHALARLGEWFPFPSGGNPFDREIREEAAILLKQVQLSEEAGNTALERLARRLSS